MQSETLKELRSYDYTYMGYNFSLTSKVFLPFYHSKVLIYNSGIKKE